MAVADQAIAQLAAQFVVGASGNVMPAQPSRMDGAVVAVRGQRGAAGFSARGHERDSFVRSFVRSW